MYFYFILSCLVFPMSISICTKYKVQMKRVYCTLLSSICTFNSLQTQKSSNMNSLNDMEEMIKLINVYIYSKIIFPYLLVSVYL